MRVHAVLASTLLITAAVTPASASSLFEWYPAECTSIDFCGPVETIAWRASFEGNALQLTFSIGDRHAIMQGTFPVSVSGDGRLHVCMRYDPFGALEVTCLLVPPRPH